ncbi:MAG: hypothetical protein Q9202_003598 [Teloschistes flavicans]
MDEDLSQVHVFGSVYPWSDQTKDEFLSRCLANDATFELQCEWIDSKRFRIITDNDQVISELLQLYAEYTHRESSSIQEICSATKSESLPLTGWGTESSGVSLQVIGLAHEEACDHMSTTIVEPTSAKSSTLADLGIMVMARSEGIVRPLKSGRLQKSISSTPPTEFWHNMPVMAHVPAKQPYVDPVQPHAAPTSIEEWVERTLHSTTLPLNAKPPLDEVTVDGNGSHTNQERRARVRRAPEPKHGRLATSPQLIGIEEEIIHELASSPALALDRLATPPKLIDIEEVILEQAPAPASGLDRPTTSPQLLDIKEEIIHELASPVASASDRLAKSPKLIDIEEVIHEPAPASASDRPESTPSSYKTASQFGTRGASQDLLTGEQEPIVGLLADSASPLAPEVLPPAPAPIVAATTLPKPRAPTALQTALSSSIAYQRSPTSKSSASQVLGENQKPPWGDRDPIAKAREFRTPSLLEVMNAEDSSTSVAKPASYLAAAKRGNAGPGYKDPPNRVLPRSSPQAREQVQVISEVQSRQFHRTMNQKTPNPGHFNLLDASRSAAIQILQPAKTFKGTLKLEVNIGRILIKTGNLPPTISTERGFDLRDWSSIFTPNSQGTNASTIFTNALPASDMDMSFLMHLRSSAGRKLFPESPSSYSTTYEFLCSTNTGDEEVVVQVADGGSGSAQVLSTEHLAGAVQWHFPRHQWDARLAVKATEKIGDYQKAAVAITDTLSVTPSANQKTLVLAAELGDSGLYFKSARMLREAKFAIDDDIIMSCVEVQNLGPAQERARYQSRKRGRETIRKDRELWWEVKACSAKLNARLERSEDLTLGERAMWEAEDIVDSKTIQHLHALATDIVSQINGIGLATGEPVVAPTSTISVAAHSELASRASQASSFW